MSVNQKKQFVAKVLSIGENVLKNNNEAMTEYVIATIEHPVNKKEISARIYMNNLMRNGEPAIKVGGYYLCTATTYTNSEGTVQVDITVSHLTNAPRSEVTYFDLLPGEAVENVPVDASKFAGVGL